MLPAAERQEPRTRAPQSITIRRAHWMRYGGTTGYPKCIRTRDHGRGQAGGPHSTECVERFRRAFEDNEDGKKSLADADLRRHEWLAKQIEDADKALVELVHKVSRRLGPNDPCRQTHPATQDGH